MCEVEVDRVIAAIGLVVLSGFASPLSAQGTGRLLGVHVAASVDRVSIYRGDATVGAISKVGWSLTTALRSPSHVGGALFLATSPSSQDPTARAPRLWVGGGWGTFSLNRNPHAGFDVFVGTGLAYLSVRGWPDFSGCLPELGCFREGGPSFENGDAVALVVGGGVTGALGRVILRGDVRLVPANDVAGQTLVFAGLGLGLVLR